MRVTFSLVTSSTHATHSERAGWSFCATWVERTTTDRLVDNWRLVEMMYEL